MSADLIIYLFRFVFLSCETTAEVSELHRLAISTKETGRRKSRSVRLLRPWERYLRNSSTSCDKQLVVPSSLTKEMQTEHELSSYAWTMKQQRRQASDIGKLDTPFGHLVPSQNSKGEYENMKGQIGECYDLSTSVTRHKLKCYYKIR